MVESGTMADQGSRSSQSNPQVVPFPMHVERVPLQKWGCRSIESGYIKKYKVGQGSYGFESRLTTL